MLNALIVDDEPLARKRLRKQIQPLEEAGRVRVVGEAGDGVHTLEVLGEQSVDLLFLDIQMPEMDGFELLRALPEGAQPSVIFITAYDEYALRAFEANAVDYLLKPVTQERLEEAVGRIESTRQTAFDERLQGLLDWVDAQADELEQASYVEQLTVSYRDRVRVIPVEQIVSIEINEGITRIYALENNEAPPTTLHHHIVDYTLDHLLDNLDPDAFVRVHRSAIIHLRHLQELVPWFSGRYKLILSTGHEVIASRKRAKELKERFLL